ncbi:MAG: SAM-dependent methyltransferase [Gammaproteobacteria bacterium]
MELQETLRAAARAGQPTVECSVDLQRSTTTVTVTEAGWQCDGRHFPWMNECKDRTIYYWDGVAFQPASRFRTSLVKLVPTEWGPPTFEIDGIKMLPTASVSPWEDAARKVGLIRPRGKVVLDTCGGLGYFAAWCLEGAAKQVQSFEKNPDVLWLRRLNPWSPESSAVSTAALSVTLADISQAIFQLPGESVDAILHDPPRFGIAGELYSAAFYEELFRVVRPRGLLFHYTGTPNRLTTGRDVPREVAKRLGKSGFDTERVGDGVLAVKSPTASRSRPLL